MKNFNYQVTVVFSPKSEEKNKEETLTKLEAMLTAAEAKVEAKDHLGLKELAYQIKSQSKGDFWVLAVAAKKPVDIKAINVFLNRDINVIRYLVLKK